MIRVRFLGDVFPGDMPHHVGLGVASQFAQHNGRPWIDRLRQQLIGADHVVGNLEAPLGRQKIPLTDFHGTKDFAEFLKETGIDYLSLANNHILEKGKEGFRETLEILDDAGIKAIGINRANNPHIEYLKKDGVTVAIAGFNAIHDIENHGNYCDLHPDLIKETLRKMVNANFKVLILHWGYEYISLPSYDQISLAKELIDAGADIIIGHHPHVVQPVMEYNRGVVFFSLGNYLFDMIYKENVRIGMTVSIEFLEDRIFNYAVSYHYIENDYCPIQVQSSDGIILRSIARIQREYEQLSELDRSEYELYFFKQLRRIKFLQRMIIKKDVLKSLIKMPKRGRKIFLSRIKRRLIGKFE